MQFPVTTISETFMVMPRFRRFLVLLIRRSLGDARWCSLMGRLRGSRTTYSYGPNGLLVASDETGRIHFYTTKRAGRYRNGIDARLEATWAKYTTGAMRFGPDDVIIDVGASIGEFALPAARAAGQVLAIEPEPRAFTALKVNAELQSNNIIAIQAAASDVTGDLSFFVAADKADSSAIEPDRFTHVDIVPGVRLADLVVEQSIDADRLALVKIEAEGYEPEVLRGLLPDVRPRFLSVNCDPERRGESPLNQVVQLMEKAGYRIDVRGFIAVGTLWN